VGSPPTERPPSDASGNSAAKQDPRIGKNEAKEAAKNTTNPLAIRRVSSPSSLTTSSSAHGVSSSSGNGNGNGNGKSRRKPVPALAEEDEKDTAKRTASNKMAELDVAKPPGRPKAVGVGPKTKISIPIAIPTKVKKPSYDSPTSPTGPLGTAVITIPLRESTTPNGSPANSVRPVFKMPKPGGASADSLLQEHILMFNNMAQLQSIVAHADELVEDYPNWRVFRDKSLYAEATPEYASLLNKHVLQQGMSLQDLDEVMGCPGLDGIPGGHRRRKSKRKGDKDCVIM
jgi:hypothetical protein